MKLDRVTITGADDSIDPGILLDLSARFPFVEWGILLSKSSAGGYRFPSLGWMERLKAMSIMTGGTLGPELKLSGHLCGSWVRALCRGERAFEADRPTIANMFQRVQINFHALAHTVDAAVFVKALSGWGVGEYIFQFDDVNNAVMEVAALNGVRAVPLFDVSGGAGIEPETWPAPIRDYSGYAGGLHPDRLQAQVARIKQAAGDARIWIDVETHVRSDNDAKFDVDRVVKFLSVATPYVSAY